MKSSFVILGCGHSESLEHFNNNALVTSSTRKLLIDCGHTIKHALSAQGMNIGEIDAIFITHVHGDHVFGLERIAYEAKFKYKKKITLFIHQSILTELWDQTLKGSLGYNGDGEACLEDYFDVIILKTKSFSYDGNHFQLFNVKHTPNKAVFGLLINERVFYSSDTVAVPDIINNISFEVGFHDVTFSPNNPVHASIDTLLEEYPKSIRENLFLMSYEDEWREHEELVSKEFKGFAKQGMKVWI